MNDEAKHMQIRWRRILFGFHLLVWLIVRLAVGSLNTTPPEAIYNDLEIWGMIVAAHGLLLMLLDGRDQARLPFAWMEKLTYPRERRWSLLIIDAAAWVMFTTAIASRLIPEYMIIRYAAPISLAWLVLTAVGMAHIGLVIYSEVRDRARRKRKNESSKGDHSLSEPTVRLTDDGELVAFPDESWQKIKHDGEA